MSEIVIVTTYQREPFLFCCLDHIRKIEPKIEIHVFPDSGTYKDPEVRETCRYFDAKIHLVPKHEYLGNSYNCLEAYRWAFNEGADFVHLIEDDVIVHADFFSWHRTMHDEWNDIFASMAWIFNRHIPLIDDVVFQPWIYSIGVCIPRDKLAAIVEHASPLYYADMPGYIREVFKDSKINSPYSIAHYEQDGLIQRVLDRMKLQTVSPTIGRCTHLGCIGYNQGWDHRADFFKGAETFAERVNRIEEFLADPYWRAQFAGREVVEYETGRRLPPRLFNYRIEMPDGWPSEFSSELTRDKLPRRINSVDLSPDARIVLES